jgi:hypothetical protein
MIEDTINMADDAVEDEDAIDSSPEYSGLTATRVTFKISSCRALMSLRCFRLDYKDWIDRAVDLTLLYFTDRITSYIMQGACIILLIFPGRKIGININLLMGRTALFMIMHQSLSGKYRLFSLYSLSFQICPHIFPFYCGRFKRNFVSYMLLG